MAYEYHGPKVKVRTVIYRYFRFILATLHVDSLLDKRTKGKVLSALDNMSAVFNGAYDDALKRIDAQLPEDRLLARRAISWITYAQRPFTTTELCNALPIEPGETSIDRDNVYYVEDIVSVCAGLVVLDEVTDIVRIVHYTAQGYFESLEWKYAVQKEMATACLAYLLFDDMQSGICSTEEAYLQRLKENAFFAYSAQYWGEHVRPVEATLFQPALDFLKNDFLIQRAAQVLLMRDKEVIEPKDTARIQINAFHLTARYGLRSLTESLLTE